MTATHKTNPLLHVPLNRRVAWHHPPPPNYCAFFMSLSNLHLPALPPVLARPWPVITVVPLASPPDFDLIDVSRPSKKSVIAVPQSESGQLLLATLPHCHLPQFCQLHPVIPLSCHPTWPPQQLLPIWPKSSISLAPVCERSHQWRPLQRHLAVLLTPRLVSPPVRVVCVSPAAACHVGLPTRMCPNRRNWRRLCSPSQRARNVSPATLSLSSTCAACAASASSFPSTTSSSGTRACRQSSRGKRNHPPLVSNHARRCLPQPTMTMVSVRRVLLYFV